MAGKISTGGGGKRDTQPVVDPNVIPFIDIMLVLLIIFMVTAPTPTVDVRVDLPPPNPVPQDMRGRNPTFVQIEDEGGRIFLYVDGEAANLDTLADTVLRHVAENNYALSPQRYYADALIFIRADHDAAYNDVVSVMSKLKEEGFAKVGIFAEQVS
ncbi:MAG: biopolymer transporter ExbD [Hydrogenophilaceae bacterium]|jgi:biopolymer transport protein ExbD|nr:biopolymer transporter ExbD [Hydrogenophilaceae bacterium]